MIDKHKILGFLGLCMRAGKLTYGTDACIGLIEKDKIRLVIIGEDAADRTKKNFTYLCSEHHIPIQIFGNIEENSRAIGKKNKAVIAIKDNNFAKQLEKMINGGELIG